MKYTRRSTQVTTPVSASKKYGVIFKGLHYRHEFARRNDTVAMEGELVLKSLGLTAGAEFGGLGGSPTICDRIIDSCLSGKGKQNSSRTRLVTFIKTHGVLPIGRPGNEVPYISLRFFKRPIKLEYLWMAFNSILRFETFATAVLGLRRPVLFPFLFMKSVEFNGQKQSLAEKADILDYEFPLMVDITVPESSLNSYLAALRINMNLSNALDESHQLRSTKKRGAPKKRKKSESIPKELEYQEGDSIRIHEDLFDPFLRILDADKRFGRNRRTVTIEKFMSGERKLLNNTSTDRGSLVETARQSFYHNLETARWLTEHYQEII